MKYICELCGTTYEEAGNIQQGIVREHLSQTPRILQYPHCCSEKESFTPLF